jgi:hypothetical protein
VSLSVVTASTRSGPFSAALRRGGAGDVDRSVDRAVSRSLVRALRECVVFTSGEKTIADGTIVVETLPRDGMLQPAARSWER